MQRDRGWADSSPGPIDLSVVIPALGEGPNLVFLLPQLRDVVAALTPSSEILVVTSDADAETRSASQSAGARLIEQQEKGYGGALLTGFSEARGRFVATMDADLSHPPVFLADLWRERATAEVLIASRYVPGGRARMPLLRRVLSRVLNRFFARGLSVPVRDLSSGFRLYQARLLRDLPPYASGFNVLQEILVRLLAEGWRVREIPFDYRLRRSGSSHARVIPFGIAYLRSFGSLWKLRNSISSADYDDRAYDSVIPLQRYWQRTRVCHVADLVGGSSRALDVGCGSSRILGFLPPGTVGLDLLARKVRYARKFGRPLVQGSARSLPFREAAFDCVVCSQVVEHLPREWPVLDELCRVLAVGGRLVLGTPDYGRWRWRAIEWLYARVAPGGYADEHITRYTREELIGILAEKGLRLEEVRYVGGAEVILALRKG
jgi:dolichol-phosphate mannosyltransferase